MKTQFEVRGNVGKVITTKGFVYACTWAPDTNLTTEQVKQAWKESRRDFLPYDETRGCYI